MQAGLRERISAQQSVLLCDQNMDASIEKKKLIIIAGPTAVGKSETAVRLASEIGGEIISGDSMQVYRGMDIGTAKVSKAEMRGIPHYLIDILDPDTDFNAVLFKQYASQACEQIYANGHIPILCGGTGFYIQGLLYDIDFTEEADRDLSYRAELQRIADEEGGEALARILEETDPVTARVTDLKNTKRVIRALEYYKLHHRSIALHNKEQSERKADSPYDYRFYVLNGERKALFDRIDKRVDRMLEMGLIDEVCRLHERGIRRDSTAAKAIGYKELYAYLDGACTLGEAIEHIKTASRHYAKRQLTWFRQEKNAIWIDTDKGDPLDEIRKYL